MCYSNITSQQHYSDDNHCSSHIHKQEICIYILQRNYFSDVSASFATSLFRTWLEERDMASLTSTLKKASLDPTLQEIYPAHKRSLDQIESYFQEKGMNELVDHVVCLQIEIKL